MIKVLSVFGTRPEAIKMAPAIRELARHRNLIDSRICVTAQHRELLDQILTLFRIEPDYDLNLMQAAQSPTQVVTAVLINLEPILLAERPDWVLVQGDTTTVMAASLAAYYANVKVGHAEAGLQTYDKTLPFPEEINRRVAGVVTDLHFAPTQRASDNLRRENVPAEAIVITGNPVIDALHMVRKLPSDLLSGALAQIPWDKRILLVTIHRRENFGVPLQSICHALLEIAHAYPCSTHIVYPVHPNPNVRQAVQARLGDVPNISLLPPLDYLSMVHVLDRCYLVLTDSGGLQEEAPSLGKPVSLLRQTTERPEGVETGTVQLVGSASQHIMATTACLLDNPRAYRRMAQAVNPYGDGQAASRIVAALAGQRIHRMQTSKR